MPRNAARKVTFDEECLPGNPISSAALATREPPQAAAATLTTPIATTPTPSQTTPTTAARKTTKTKATTTLVNDIVKQAKLSISPKDTEFYKSSSSNSSNSVEYSSTGSSSNQRILIFGPKSTVVEALLHTPREPSQSPTPVKKRANPVEPKDTHLKAFPRQAHTTGPRSSKTPQKVPTICIDTSESDEEGSNNNKEQQEQQSTSSSSDEEDNACVVSVATQALIGSRRDTSSTPTSSDTPTRRSGPGLLPSVYPIVIDLNTTTTTTTNKNTTTPTTNSTITTFNNTTTTTTTTTNQASHAEAAGADARFPLAAISEISLANQSPSSVGPGGGPGESASVSPTKKPAAAPAAAAATGASGGPTNAPVKRRRYRRSGRSRNSAKENRRLATLRARRAQEQAKKFEDEQQRLRQQEQQQREQQRRAKSAGRFAHLDEELLNRIEVLEYEPKKAAGKRKRGLTFPVTTTTINTRTRTAQRQILGIADQSRPEAASAGTSKQADGAGSASPSKSQPPSASGTPRKRGRNTMSLSDRRYQVDDTGGALGVGGAGVRGGNLNGYVGASRTGSSENNGGDAQDMSVLNGNLANISHAPSMATLCNIGNTCYLNSVVYTLRFAPRFLHNLHHLLADLRNANAAKARLKANSLGRGGSLAAEGRSWSPKEGLLPELGHHHQLSSSGSSNGLHLAGGGEAVVAAAADSPAGAANKFELVTERLHELYQHLHCNEMAESTEPFHADTLLNAIQDVSTIFEGNQQQDAHEFLMCLLNSLRETCQQLIQRLRECPDLLRYCRLASDDLADGETSSQPLAGPSSQHSSSSSLSLSSLSTSHLSKSSLFQRKSKRKDEAKASKNSRVQSPLKDSPTSLFYLNASSLEKGSPPELGPPAAAAADSLKALKGGGDSMEVGSSAGSQPVSDEEMVEEKIREFGLNFFHEDFEGVTVATTKCLSCETVTEQRETMIDIAVPVPIAGFESSDGSERSGSFIQNACITREYFRGENKYRCEQCTGYTEAIRSISYEVLPRLLIIQLSRFSGGMEKINSYIPTSFTLQCFCSKCCELDEPNKLHAYKLYSVITHVGATMSVGHYIAYTTALDWAHEYINCPKDRRFGSQTLATQQQQGGGLGQPAQPTSGGSSSSSGSSTAANFMKKMKLGRSKTSSSSAASASGGSGDLSKGAAAAGKQLNGLTSKGITNGLGKMSMNTTCHSLSCCATRLCNYAHQQQLYQQQQQAAGADASDDAALQNGVSSLYMGSGAATFPSGYGSTARAGSYQRIPTPIANGNSNEPIWYMCDDDKIKAMSQREFEDLLSPSRKITVTPYLLFYARTDLQQTKPQAATSPGAAAAAGKPADSGGAVMGLSGPAAHKL